MSVLDWERLFKKINRGKNKFPLYQALFIQILSKYGPIESKSYIKKLLVDEGLNEVQFEQIFTALKKMHVLKYNIGYPKGFYIEPTAIDRIQLEYPEPIKIKNKNKNALNEKSDDIIIKFEKINKHTLRSDQNLNRNDFSNHNEEYLIRKEKDIELIQFINDKKRLRKKNLTHKELEDILSEWIRENYT